MSEKRPKPERPSHKERRLTPVEFIIGSMLRAAPNGEAVDEMTLVRICVTAGAPSEAKAKIFLQNLVEDGVLLESTTKESSIKTYRLAANFYPSIGDA